MKKIIILTLLLTSALSFSQIKQNSGDFWQAKEWSKDISLFRAKSYLFKNILGTTEEVVKFSIIPLAASKSGQLTTLIYKCEELNKSGIILGFYGNYWNENGVLYQGYSFKNLEKEKAILFLNKLQSVIDENGGFLKEDLDNNNISFEFDDMQILMWLNNSSFVTIRIFWNNFDSTWDPVAFKRTKKRFKKNI